MNIGHWARLVGAALISISTVSGATAIASLSNAAVGERLTVSGLSIHGAAAKSSDEALTLERIDVYAPGARLWAVGEHGHAVELPRSGERYFLEAGRRGMARLYLALSADGKSFHGMSVGAEGTRAFSGVVGKRGLQVRRSGPAQDDNQHFACAADGHDIRHRGVDRNDPLRSLPISKGGVLHSAVVAVDTDNELMSTKFANNTGTATTYLANLFAGMTLFYERDLNVRLLQGDTFLRVAADSYSQTDGFAQLNEVGANWLNTPALFAIDRAFVMFLSGKSPSTGQASGIAWLLDSGSYCASKGTNQGGGQVAGHFSAIQVFKSPGSPASNDVSIVGHELGHNFGAAHTHCTSMTGSQPASTNTIDRCFNGEAGSPFNCYAGAVSCPTDNSVSGQGSIMSYCNFGGANGAGCAANSGRILQEFHPVHQGVLATRVATNIANGCFDLVVAPPADRVFADGFE